jgi:hypothetical protein
MTVSAAEVERVRPLLFGARQLPALVRGDDVIGLDSYATQPTVVRNIEPASPDT